VIYTCSNVETEKKRKQILSGRAATWKTEKQMGGQQSADKLNMLRGWEIHINDSGSCQMTIFCIRDDESSGYSTRELISQVT
jgi:hypothetical protein